MTVEKRIEQLEIDDDMDWVLTSERLPDTQGGGRVWFAELCRKSYGVVTVNPEQMWVGESVDMHEAALQAWQSWKAGDLAY